MRIIKLVSALIIAALAITALTLLAMRYMDVIMKPYNALRRLKDKVTSNFSDRGDACCCSEDDVAD